MGLLDCQGLKRAIMGDEDIAGLLKDSSASIFHTFPGDFGALCSLQGVIIYGWGNSRHG